MGSALGVSAKRIFAKTKCLYRNRFEYSMIIMISTLPQGCLPSLICMIFYTACFQRLRIAALLWSQQINI